MRFLDVFLLHCLLADSPPDTPEEIAALARNQQRAAARGREPGLRLERGATEIALVDWGAEVVDACEPIARRLDFLYGGEAHAQALRSARHALAHPATLPSARVLDALAHDFDRSFVAFVRAQSEQVKRALLRLPFPPEAEAHYAALARESVAEQQQRESVDIIPFEIFREQYLDIRGLRL